MAYDPEKTHRMEMDGNSWEAGIIFSTKNFKAVFTSHPTIGRLGEFVDRLRAIVAANGRDPRSVKVFTAILPIGGLTEEEAQEKLKIGLENTSYQGGIARFGGFTSVYLVKYSLDVKFDFDGKEYQVGIHS
ncbi:hypothetical protein BJ878DRAFT_539599 [Calycina marina]|uniref:Uncharacterized protein n=1 Tax=Calycina marina TaxID=1763456 RepID=A0A9P8CHU2_9HELO|nr:hypothetical protein BJ878DRAFT_539599 [Calycina marina]